MHRFWLIISITFISTSSVCAAQGVETTGSDVPLPWTVGPEPLVEIGATDEALLYGVVDAARLSDGSFVIANGGSDELLVFSPAGQYRATIGGQGDGPGEFRWLASVQVGPRDSLYAFDITAQRLSVFDSRGVLARTNLVRSATGSRLSTVQRLNGGGWYGREAESLKRTQARTLGRDTIAFGRLDDEMEWSQEIVRLPARITASTLVMGQMAFRTAAFSPSPAHDHFGKCLYVTSSDEPRVLVFTDSGARVRTIELTATARRVTNQDVDAWVEANLKNTPKEQRAILQRVLTDAPRPEVLPHYGGLIVDDQGMIWLQEYRSPFGFGRTWTVLTPDGQVLGQVEFPSNLHVFEIASGHVLALARTPLDEEVVRLYALHRESDHPAKSLPACLAAP